MGLPRRLAVRLGAQALLVSITSSITNLSLCLLCAEESTHHTLKQSWSSHRISFKERVWFDCTQVPGGGLWEAATAICWHWWGCGSWGLGNSASLQASSALRSVLAACRSPGLPAVNVGAALCSGEQECVTVASSVRALAGVFLATGCCQNAVRI